MRVFMFAASARQDSVNKKLIQIAANTITNKNLTGDLADFQEFDMPLYHGDIENTQGLPQNANLFIQRLNQADGLIISSPEYNYSIPGTLKNLIDWVSRAKPMPWSNKKILLLSASPSLVGGNRGLWQTRIPLEGCGAFVFPEMFSLASAYECFNNQGQLKDTATLQRLENLIDRFIDWL